MTRRPPLAPQAVARAWWAKVREQGFTWRRFEKTPAPPRLWVASSSGRAVVLFRSRFGGKSAPERASTDAPLVTSRHRQEDSMQPARVLPDKPPTAHGVMSPRNTTQGQLCTPPSLRAGWSQLGSGRIEGRHERSADDAGVEEPASLPGCVPRRAKQAPEASVTRGCGGDVCCLAMQSLIIS